MDKSFPSPGRLSLKLKILVPLISLSFLVFSVIFWIFHYYLVSSFEMEIRKRAETIASTIIYSSDASQDPRQIQRLVTTLNLEPDIRLIVASTGNPPVVFASSRVQWVDKPISSLHDLPERPFLRASTMAPKGMHFEKRVEDSFIYITSFMVTGSKRNAGLIGNGALLLELDVSSFMDELANVIMLMTIGLACSTGLIALLIYLTIRRYILRPAVAIQTVMENRVGGNLQERVPVYFQDEIGSIARSLNQMLDQLEREAHHRGMVEKRLRESESKLLELNSNKDKFFSIISHDLKSPFSALLGFSRILEDEYNSSTPEQQLVFIQRIVGGLSNLYKLLENLLEWSRIQLGGVDFHPEHLDLGLIVYEIVNLNKLSLEKKGVKPIIEIPDGTAVFADENMIKTILRNLISNAIKFSSSGHAITIRLTPSSTSEQVQSGFVGVAVVDTGTGISESDLGLLFRIDSGFRRKGTANETGTGLGLVLCKEFVDAHGGVIWAESKVGEGSVFIFTVPLA